MDLAVEAVDDVLEDQRDADVGGLGQDQEGQGQDHPAPVLPQERREGAQRPDVAGFCVGHFGGVDVAAHGRYPDVNGHSHKIAGGGETTRLQPGDIRAASMAWTVNRESMP